MIQIKLEHSQLSSHLKWNIDWSLSSGVCNWLRGPNGAGKSSLLEEIKLQWKSFSPDIQLGFTDQDPLNPFQDLKVSQVFDLLWDIAPDRRSVADWKTSLLWDDVSRSWWSRPVNLLSGGENQWLKILMMRSLKSGAWLLDEPFQSLDKDRQHQLQTILQEWISQGNYLLMTEHGEPPRCSFQEWQLINGPRGMQVTAEVKP